MSFNLSRKYLTAKFRKNILISAIISGLAAAIFVVPSQFRSAAGIKLSGENLSKKSGNASDTLENYDIRTDKTQTGTLLMFRGQLNKNAVQIADLRDKFVAGENALRQKVPNLTVEYNDDLHIPEVIAPDVKKGRAFLSLPSKTKRSDILLDFVQQNNDLLGVSPKQTGALKLAADYTNPDGNLSFTQFNQTINDIPVFRGEIKAGFNKDGEMIRVVNNLAPDLNYANLSTDFGDPSNAVKSAAAYLDYQLKVQDMSANKAASNDLKTVFGDAAIGRRPPRKCIFRPNPA